MPLFLLLNLDYNKCILKVTQNLWLKLYRWSPCLSSSFSPLARDIITHVSSLWSFSFSRIVRQGNTIVHTLTQRARQFFPLFVWMESVPSDVADYVLIDVPVH